MANTQTTSVAFTWNSSPIDPSSVTFSYETPLGQEIIYQFNVGSVITRTGVGTYQATIPITGNGTYFGQWAGVVAVGVALTIVQLTQSWTYTVPTPNMPILSGQGGYVNPVYDQTSSTALIPGSPNAIPGATVPGRPVLK